jgi:transcriptional regulator of acetoin/glycerol metabolism
VRELKAVIELAIILSEENKIGPGHINFIPVETGEETQVGEMTLEEHIRRIVRESLLKYNHNPTIVAAKLGISRPTVYRYIREFNL